ncbi:hypothetical protein [Verrucomicrobium sp. BvORR034]|uniref:hypothetical protein n=1 Tax=Verrucomicrobium sp. BvORR034 TaxID=1396418 RepID=UPI000B062486|nr:hypothetical protein [Verrucomicrobium sp. BvORR034]
MADIQLGGPGVPVDVVVATKVPFKISYQLPNSYRFVFRGIEARGDTLGAPGSSGTNGNGGQFHLSATVSTSVGSEKVGKIEFRDVQDFNLSVLKTMLITQAVYKATSSPISVSMEWAGQGNAHKPNGFFNILGEHQLAPPVPVGKLEFAVGDMLLTAAGTQPPGTATITRD